MTKNTTNTTNQAPCPKHLSSLVPISNETDQTVCPNCFYESFHYQNEGLEEDNRVDHDCKSGCPCEQGNDDD